MKALVYHGPGQRGWDTVEDPSIIDPTDVVVRIDTSTICGGDLHILRGDVPETNPGTVLGHEAVGTVQEIGANVSTVAIGDRVPLSCVVGSGRLDPTIFATQRFSLEDAMSAYDTVADAANT